MNMTRLFAIVFLTTSFTAANVGKTNAGAVFKEIDDQGNVTFTDRPSESGHSTKIEIGPVNTQKAMVPPAPPKKPEKSDDEPEEVNYSSARITQPTDDSTVPPGQLNVVVQIALRPQLQAGHLVRLYHNGRRHGKPTSATSFSLTNLIRGEHQVRAEVIGTNGKIKSKTQTVIFFVKRYVPRN